MKNYVQKGDVLAVAAPAALESGSGVLVGSLFGVAATAAAQGQEVELVTVGVFDLAKASGEAWAVGAKVYWDDTAKNTTTVDVGNTLVGAAIQVAGSASTVGRVRLNGFVG